MNKTILHSLIQPIGKKFNHQISRQSLDLVGDVGRHAIYLFESEVACQKNKEVELESYCEGFLDVSLTKTMNLLKCVSVTGIWNR